MTDISEIRQEHYSDVWQRFMPGVAWGTVSLFFAIVLGYAVTIYFSLAGHIPYFLSALICGYLAYASFTVMHDAGHGGIVKMGSPLKPLEDVLGWISSLPLLIVPYRFFQKIHDRHHAFTNDPERDPDHFTLGEQWYMVLLNCMWIPFRYHLMSVTSLRHLKTFSSTYVSTLVYLAITISSVTYMINAGYSDEFLAFVFFPGIIAVIVLPLFFDYIPHHPHKSQDRYQNTRIFPGQLWNILLLGQSYHLIHHLYPRLPWYKYQGVYQKILPYLDSKGAPIEDIFSGERPRFLKSPLASGLKDKGDAVNMLLSVASIRSLTGDSVEVSLALPEGERLNYRAGQYITVSKWLNNEHQTRCYSLSSAPENGELQIGVKKVEQGLFSGFLNDDLDVGDELIVRGPFGDFSYPAQHSKPVDHLVLVAAGSGITPVLAIMESALISKNATVHLIYACRDANNIMFADKISELMTVYSNCLKVDFVFSSGACLSEGVSWKSIIGRLDKAMLRDLLPSIKAADSAAQTDFYICGPEGLKNSVTEFLSENNIDDQRVHVEAFVALAAAPKGKQHEINILLSDGSDYVINVASNQTILQVAAANGITLPHACGNGTCGTCKFRVTKGAVKPIDKSVPGITASEQEAGYTLACQCHPESELQIKEWSR
ncbi:hypothetical protein CS022_03040 [Veronia nyctiphanis]|uniref:Uncharacterized protein n=1 Tax=Veronia nyctiphanis TaxID=1278244 RepID=A0A4Q0YUS6_9GAMM|nr:fatty acid desaturase [Veronia nyctiphanis]RXJ74563.1 hypothetical protein CS022_03040 [Veronia nyctiphanis]